MKSVLVFGGARGIGQVVAGAFVSGGFGVTVTARTGKDLDETVRGLSLKGEVLAHQADVSVYSQVKDAVFAHLSKFKKIDVMVNAAAVQGPIGALWENNPEEWTNNISINLIGSFYLCRAVVPRMKKEGNGIIILFSGGGAAYARPYFSAYGVSKTGVLRLTETLNKELDGGPPSIYAIAPGAVKTNMTSEVLEQKEKAREKAYSEAKKIMEDSGTPPEKASDLCLFLAKEQPKCLSGRLIHVNEPYREYVDKFEGKEIGNSGLLRRTAFK